MRSLFILLFVLAGMSLSTTVVAAGNPGKLGKQCVGLSESPSQTSFTNTCNDPLFIIYCGDLKHSALACNQGPEGGYFTHSRNIEPGDTFPVDLFNGGFVYWGACMGNIGFGTEAYTDNGNGIYSCNVLEEEILEEEPEEEPVKEEPVEEEITKEAEPEIPVAKNEATSSHTGGPADHCLEITNLYWSENTGRSEDRFRNVCSEPIFFIYCAAVLSYHDLACGEGPNGGFYSYIWNLIPDEERTLTYDVSGGLHYVTCMGEIISSKALFEEYSDFDLSCSDLN